MAHEIKPTLWDASICAVCGFPASQHEVLYGALAEQGEAVDR